MTGAKSLNRQGGMRSSAKVENFGHLMQRVDSLEKTLMLGGIGGRRRKGHFSHVRLCATP